MKARKLARPRKLKTRVTEPSARWKTITVRLGRLGAKTQDLELPPGTTVKDLVRAQRLEEYSIRLNGEPVRLSTELKSGDLMVAGPRSIVGGSAGRYDHLDLDECRRTMSSRDFEFFVNFVGADMLGFKDEDSDAC